VEFHPCHDILLFLVPVIAGATKLPMALPQISKKVERRLAPPRGVGKGDWVKFHTSHDILRFSLIIEKL
jgi:hypothetical protein